MPYLDSNIPSTIFYFAFGAQITYATIFQRNSEILINQMMKQGGKINKLLSTLDKSFGRHFHIFHKHSKAFLNTFHVFLITF